MKLRNLLIAIFMIGFTFVSYSQKCDILDKVVKASGGAEKFANVKTSYFEGKMEIKQGQAMELGMKMWNKENSKYRMEQEVMGMTMKQGYDGEKAWMSNPMTGATEALPLQQAMQLEEQMKELTSLHPFMDWKKQGYTCEELGNEEVDGKQCLKIKITDRKKEETTYYVDAITYLIHKVTMKSEGQDVAMFFKEYQKKEGMYVPKVMETQVNGSVAMIMTITKIDVNIPIADDIFAMPK